MYSVVVAFRVGVICKSCGQVIEIEDEYIRGVPAIEMAAGFYKPVQEQFRYSLDVSRQQKVTCGNPDCGKTHEYRADDLLPYDE